MTFLDLCRRLRMEAGLSGDGPTAIAGQVGINAKLIAWVRQGYQDILNLPRDWDFMWRQVSIDLPAHAVRVDLAGDYQLTDVGRIVTDTMRIGGARCRFEPDFSLLSEMLPGARLVWSRLPDRRIALAPATDTPVSMAFDYYRDSHDLISDADVPLMPAPYRMAIVWRALMHYAGHDSAPDLYATGERNYQQLLAQMDATQRQVLRRGGVSLDRIESLPATAYPLA